MSCEPGNLVCNGTDCIPERPERGRIQHIVQGAGELGGITLEEALVVGWRLLPDDHLYCPFCANKEVEVLQKLALALLFPPAGDMARE